MTGGCFTDVVLHSSKNCHQEHATEPSRLPKDVVATWGDVIWKCCRIVSSLTLKHGGGRVTRVGSSAGTLHRVCETRDTSLSHKHNPPLLSYEEVPKIL